MGQEEIFAMRIVPALALCLVGPAAFAAPAPGLIAAGGPGDVAALVGAEPANAVDTLRAAALLGLGDPVDVIFAGVTPATPRAEAEALAGAAVAAAPDLAEQVAAASIVAAGIEGDLARLAALAAAVIAPLLAAELTPAARGAEIREVLIALLSLADPALAAPLAEAVAALTPDPADDGAALLAALAPSLQTGAVNPGQGPGRGFGARPDIPVVLPPRLPEIARPRRPDRDAPSAN